MGVVDNPSAGAVVNGASYFLNHKCQF